MVSVTVPGKLFLMGEYSVIRGDSPAIIMPTKKTLTVHLQASDQWGFKSDFERSSEEPTWDAFFTKAFKALRAILTTLDAHLNLTPVTWTVESQLDDQDHALGLGSSGAFTVAMIEASFAYFQKPLTPFESFKLSAMTQNDPTSSYGDLAVQAYKTPIYYQRPRAIFDHFDDVIIEPVTVPFHYLIVHSGKKVKSAPFVKAFFDKIKVPAVKAYIETMNHLVEAFKKEPTMALIAEAMRAYQKMAETVDAGIISPSLQEIINIVTTAGAVAKVSGAGGGDNLCAFYSDSKTYQRLIQKLEGYPLL